MASTYHRPLTFVGRTKVDACSDSGRTSLRKKAVFLDRDGTIMIDTGYCHEPDKVQLIQGASEGLRLMDDAGFLLAVVTNQSGLARGYFTDRELYAVNSRLRQELQSHGADFDVLFYCPHHPDDSCNCRKPQPGLILQAASDYNLDLPSSFTIGDKESDVQAGHLAQTRTILVSRKLGTSRFADFLATDLVEAAHIVINNADKVTNHAHQEICACRTVGKTNDTNQSQKV